MQYIKNYELDYSIPGLKIIVYSTPEPFNIMIVSAVKRDWNLYVDEKALISLPPPTFLDYKGKLYLIFESEEKGNEWYYKLNPAPDGESIINLVQLDPAVFIAKEISKNNFIKAEKKLKQSVVYDFLLGWLPVRIQEQIADHLGYAVEDAIRRNATVEFISCLSASMLTLIMAVGTQSMQFLLITAILFYFTLEGISRKMTVQYGDRMHGMYLLELLDWIYVKIRNSIRKKI